MTNSDAKRRRRSAGAEPQTKWLWNRSFGALQGNSAKRSRIWLWSSYYSRSAFRLRVRTSRSAATCGSRSPKVMARPRVFVAFSTAAIAMNSAIDYVLFLNSRVAFETLSTGACLAETSSGSSLTAAVFDETGRRTSTLRKQRYRCRGPRPNYSRALFSELRTSQHDHVYRISPAPLVPSQQPQPRRPRYAKNRSFWRSTTPAPLESMPEADLAYVRTLSRSICGA